jgi:hypothetical protein
MKRLLPILLLMLLAMPASASASRSQEAMFQDDDELIYTSIKKRKKTLDELRSLGVDRIRVTVLWRAIAPKPKAKKKPKRFDAANPGAYPPGIWTNYDLLAKEATKRGIELNFNITGPSPRWANKKAPRSDIQDNYEPSPAEFKKFVMAVGKRYSGKSVDGPYGYDLPRVDYFSIWNEPNHSGWLTPTWDKVKGKFVQRSASLYRELLDAAWDGLRATGHGRDTILIGETAPAGNDSKDVKRFMTPLTFIQALYCVDDRLKRLKGKDAKRLNCPPSKSAFRKQNPALFKASGFAHHPYQLLTAPDVEPDDERIITISVLDRLKKVLDTALRRHGVSRKLPIYLTEFGYQTKPDGAGVSFAKQAAFINQAEYLAARESRVKSMSQFLLIDGPPPIGLTFQSGLKNRKGKKKPAYEAYQLPVWVTPKGKVWGLVRPAKPGQRVKAKVQFRGKGGKWDTIKTVKTKGPNNVFTARAPKREGKLRVKAGKLESRSVKLD